jgi:hypothetical protein
MPLTGSATARSSGELAWNPPRLDRAAYLRGRLRTGLRETTTTTHRPNPRYLRRLRCNPRFQSLISLHTHQREHIQT